MSSSEYLTFYRRFALQSRSSIRTPARQATRPFSVSALRFKTDDSVKTDQYPDSEHATDKKDKLDVQSEQSSKGREAKSQDTGGQATSESDARNSNKKFKDEMPEAPDAIGFQDERGGKGHS